MSELTLISAYRQPLQPLISAALGNELRLLDSGIRRTKQRLGAYETKYNLPTREFIRRFATNEFDETLELIEWIGEYRMLERLEEKRSVLKGIEFAN